ncbi:MAG: ABC transporter permease [Gemmatimonadetes bacterium]|nr:ABC transporter permease [Gemmatimonadota bacterium]MBI2535510.1 ABC transporter permease [Gemmatimonadota bacterium]MBI3082185.1 ABC transporter permease [Gemmatimonadota bacterium]
MAAFLARRLGAAVLVAFGVATITFLLIHLAPGSPLAGSGENPYVSAEAIAQMRRNFALDRPIHIQYVRYLTNLLRGDWGLSFTMHRPVLDAFRDALPNTLLLAAAALLVDFLLGVTVGTLQGMRPGSRFDRVCSAVTLTLYSVPTFWLGLMLVLVFGQELGWLPVSGVVDPALYHARDILGKLWDRAAHLILPGLTLGLIGAAATARYQRAAVLEVIRQDFIRTARAKGLSERAVAVHALRNAVLPTITLFGLSLPVLLSGAVLVETVFAWPGMGRLAFEAIQRRDYPVVTGAATLVALAVVAGNFVADVLTRIADPRTREAQ